MTAEELKFQPECKLTRLEAVGEPCSWGRRARPPTREAELAPAGVRPPCQALPQPLLLVFRSQPASLAEPTGTRASTARGACLPGLSS